MSVFKDLLSIKAFRENKAEIAVRKQREVVASAQTKCAQCEDELARFRDYAVRHERELYERLIQSLVKLRDIEDVQLQVADLRGQEQQREQLLKEAERAHEQEAQRLDVEQAHHKAATQAKEKFVQIVQVYAEEEFKELERKEDAELEEAAETRRERDDWDEHISQEPI
jgi:type III secretion protein O